jgi:hypothetical protein
MLLLILLLRTKKKEKKSRKHVALPPTQNFNLSVKDIANT